MTNPVAQLRTFVYNDSEGWVYKSVLTWCPACDEAHPFRVELNSEIPTHSQHRQQETWNWDGNLITPTFDPSLNCIGNVDTCDPDFDHYMLCELGEDCESPGHAFVHINPEGRIISVRMHENIPRELWLKSHRVPCQRPRGNCHSYLKNGIWEFLSDSAHHMAGQKVPMVPIPDWFYDDDTED